MDRNFAYGGKYAVDRARELLDSRIRDAVNAVIEDYNGDEYAVNDAIDAIVGLSNHWGLAWPPEDWEAINKGMVASKHRESAAYFYYLGVRSLFVNDDITAQRCFEWAKHKGYNDGAKGKKLARHLENLT